MTCRAGCGACCIAPSISSPIPGMPFGKPAGIPCAQLTAERECAIFSADARPAVCRSLQPNDEMCQGDVGEVFRRLEELERATNPG